MKKIFLFIAMAVLSSCSTYLQGDVLLMNDDGTMVRSYPNSIIEYREAPISYICGMQRHSIKDGGMLNFEDADGISHLISGGIICVDNLREVNARGAKEGSAVVSEQDWLINSIQSLDKSIRAMEKKIKENKKNGEDTAELERILREKEDERDNLAKTLWEKYNALPYII